jgi:hypothetical protein
VALTGPLDPSDVAVTVHDNNRPTSAKSTVYVLDVAVEIDVPLRFHWKVYAVVVAEETVHVPVVDDIVFPT